MIYYNIFYYIMNNTRFTKVKFAKLKNAVLLAAKMAMITAITTTNSAHPQAILLQYEFLDLLSFVT